MIIRPVVVTGGHTGIELIPSLLISRDTTDGQAATKESRFIYSHKFKDDVILQEIFSNIWFPAPTTKIFQS
jgi:hypothetical protein